VSKKTIKPEKPDKKWLKKTEQKKPN
jgi:hypothetical protein